MTQSASRRLNKAAFSAGLSTAERVALNFGTAAQCQLGLGPDFSPEVCQAVIDRAKTVLVDMLDAGVVTPEALKADLGEVMPGAVVLFAAANGYDLANGDGHRFNRGLEAGAFGARSLAHLGILLEHRFAAGRSKDDLETLAQETGMNEFCEVELSFAFTGDNHDAFRISDAVYDAGFRDAVVGFNFRPSTKDECGKVRVNGQISVVVDFEGGDVSAFGVNAGRTIAEYLPPGSHFDGFVVTHYREPGDHT